MTDVWTSVGVVVGVGLVWVTGWLWLDPVIAIAVALNIVWTGWQLMHRSAAGLMDVSLPEEKVAEIEAVLKSYREQGLDFHALRTRQAGSRAFVSVHVLVPGQWTVKEAHDWAERIERDIRKVMPRVNAMTHLEPLEDPVSMLDQDLDRLHC
jgi:cation diffusion facilitator family transporter